MSEKKTCSIMFFAYYGLTNYILSKQAVLAFLGANDLSVK